MRLRRAGGLATTALAALICISCGQIYRPVVIPTTTTPPNPSGFHEVFSINTNVPDNPGTGMQIDVSGDSVIGAANMGVNPTHAGILPNNSRVFVANAGSLSPDDADNITAFTPAADSSVATGLGNPLTFSLPSGSLPIFVNTSQNTTVFIANYGTNSVVEINAQSSVVALSGTTGNKPVAMIETPNGQNLYVANQADNTITNLSPTDLTTQATIQVGSIPTWVLSRVDGQRVYVVTQGDGNLYTINTATNAVISTLSVGGPGANFASYDTSRNRLYVTNPTAGAVYVFDATTDPPNLLSTIAVPTPPIASTASLTTNCSAYTCTYTPVAAVSVAALPDASRFYVASYVIGTATCLTGDTCQNQTPIPPPTCPDATVTAAGCIIPQITVYDAGTFAQKTDVFPLFPSVGGVQSFAVAPIIYCAPVVPYGPSSARFRMSAAAAADSSHVYSSVCDAGAVAIVATTTSSIAVNGNTPDTLVTDLPTPFSAGAPGSNGQPATQTPIFLFTGQ
jgi:YVTN family beta-propeller protein